MTANERLAQQRAELAAADERLARDLARRYGVAYQALKDELDRIIGRIAAAQAAGEPVTEAWLYREKVLSRLEQRVRAEVQVYVENAAGAIGNATVAAHQLGSTHAAALVGAVTPPPLKPLAAILHRTRLDGPLAALLDAIAPQAAADARDTLVAAVVRGDHPTVAAATLRTQLRAPMWRTLRIARTETIGAYRDAAVRTYQANSGSLDGWVWVATLSPRTCAACWAMHGTIHPLDEPFASHPNCRCTPAPLSRPWADLGFPDAGDLPLRIDDGETLFAKLPDDQQLQILGPGKFAAWQAGTITLARLVQPTLHPVWGAGIRERSLQDALAA